MSSVQLSTRTAKLVDVLFSEGQRETARSLLEDHCGTNLPSLSDLDPIQLERYRFAAIRISNGDIESLERAIALANTDWRDLLMEADFGHDTQAHERWCARTLRAAGSAL
jgi:hypothetical protein